MMKMNFLFRCGLIVLLMFVVLTSIFVLSPHAAIMMQRKLGTSGGSFTIGGQVFVTEADWLLTSSRARAGDTVRLYGLLPLPEAWVKDTLPGRYFSFSEISDTGKKNFVFTETELQFNERLRKWLEDHKIASAGMNGCHVERNILGNMSALQCMRHDSEGWIVYIPQIRLSIISESKDLNIWSYLADASDRRPGAR